jgi:predicted nucleic acid-binding protein
VLLETANTLARPNWRAQAIGLIDHLQQRLDVRIVPLQELLWQRGYALYRKRLDKGWSLTDCISFLVMQEAGINDALTADEHFRQAGFHAVLLDDPEKE